MPGHGALLDDVALQLRHCPNDCEYRLAHGCAGIERFLAGNEADAERFEVNQGQN
jgi:hypothetical protein